MGLLQTFAKFLRRQTTPQQPNATWFMYPYMREAGVTVTHETALTFDAVYACVRWLSSMIAMLPWDLYQKIDERKREQIHNDTSWLIEQQPNPELTSFGFRELLMLWASTWGNGYAEIERGSLTGRVAALWPISPDRVTVRRDPPPSRALYYEVTNPNGGGENIRIEPRDMFHIRGPGYDGMQGYSVIALAARTIGMGIAMEQYGGNFFGNGARPSGILKLEGNLTPEAAKNLKQEWEAAYGGSNAQKTAVLPKGIDYESISATNSEGRLIELDEATVRKTCRWFGVPPHKVFDLKNAHYNNIEHQSIEAVTDSLMPWIVRFETEFSLKVLGRNQQGRQYSKMNVNGLLRGDSAARANYYKAMLSSGVFSINDVLELEDRNDIGPLGDERYMQIQYTTLENISEGKNMAAKPAGGTEPQPEDDGPDEEQQPPQEEQLSNEPDTLTVNPVDPTVVEIDVEKDGRRRTLTDSIVVEAALEPILTAVLERLIRKERLAASKKSNAPAKVKTEWANSFIEEQHEMAVAEFAQVAKLHEALTGVVTEPDAWAQGYYVSLPNRLEQAMGRTKPDVWYQAVGPNAVAELTAAAKEFAKGAK